jgi:PAS domain S-box-containing protein
MRGKQEKRTTLLIAVVAVGGAVAFAALAFAFRAPVTPNVWRHAAVLVVLSCVAELIQIRVRHGESNELLTLFELAIVADLVFLPPVIAVGTALIGLALSLVIQRKKLVKFLFNCGQYALGLVPAAALYRTVGHGDFRSTLGLLTLLAGMAIFTAANLVTISAILAVTTGKSIRRLIADERGVSFALGLGNSAVGMVAVSLWLTRPELTPAVLAPTIALRQAFKGWVQQKELTRNLQEESEKLGHILENSSEGIVLADENGLVLLWSPSMERMTGVSKEEAVGKSMSYLLRGRNSFGQSTSLETSGSVEAIELEIVATDGTPRWLHAQHGPGYDEDGKLSFDVVVISDITRQREVERLKDDFFSTVSHELRTPLTPIKGYASLLLRRGADIPEDRRKEALQSIVERTDHMARLVEDLLLASRIASGSERRLPEVNRQPVDVPAVTEKALRSFRLAHPTRDFAVETGAGITALGDSIRVEQIVANLVSNAVKFSEEGAPVFISVAADETNAIVVVRDEGRGIPSDKQEEIFEKFKRVEDPLVMETGGAGLGLFIVKQLAAAMAGSVEVTSELGRGATFTVKLPLAGPGAPSLPMRRVGDAS